MYYIYICMYKYAERSYSQSGSVGKIVYNTYIHIRYNSINETQYYLTLIRWSPNRHIKYTLRMRICGWQSNTWKYWHSSLSKSINIFTTLFFQRHIWVHDWKYWLTFVARVSPKRRINNCTYVTIDLLRKIVVSVQKWKCYLSARNI